MLLDERGIFPQGLKPRILCVSDGTAEQLGEKLEIEAKWGRIF